MGPEDEAKLKAWFRSLRPEGVSADELAARLGVDRKTVYSMENPEKPWPRGKTLIQYLQASGVLKDAPPPPPTLVDELSEAVRLLREAVELLREAR